MKQEKLLYRDTLNFTPIDVIKGVDLITKKIVMANDPAPEGYEVKPKCKFCKNFLHNSDDEYMGTCKVSKNNFMAYSDMTATTCKEYERSDL
ncbi:MAG: 4-hydroxyphenylacetate decarboxylase small subunit [Proteobacteria bacterium]|nr:4-hydroxyphenylacetate decarboxylase small subunit [Pseudomonadota bacterium]